MALTKANIVGSICNQLDLPKNRSVAVVDSVLEIIKRTLASGEDVLITGFGKFCVKDKEKRRGRNPQTGKDITLRPSRVVTFRCSGVLREKINRKAAAKVRTQKKARVKKPVARKAVSLTTTAAVLKIIKSHKMGIDAPTLMKKTLFSTPEVAESLGVFHTTVRRWIERGKIKGVRVGRNYKVPVVEVIRLLEEHGVRLLK